MSTAAKARQSKTNNTEGIEVSGGCDPSVTTSVTTSVTPSVAPSEGKKQRRSRVSVEIDSDLYETYKDMVQSRAVVQTTSALVSLFCKNAKIREQVAKEIGVMALKA